MNNLVTHSPKQRERRHMTRVELAEKLHALQLPSDSQVFTADREAELQSVLHDLEVYQIELEMQNRELRESRQLIEISNERYVNLYDFAPIGYLTLNELGFINEINLTASTMLGIERRWLIGRSITPWILKSELPLFRAHLQALGSNENEKSKVTTTLHIVRRDKTVLPVESVSTYSTNPLTGEVLYKTTLSDLTERRKAEEERDRFFNLSADLLCICGSDGYFKRLNPAWESVLGHSLVELSSKPFIEFVHPEDRDSTLTKLLALQRTEETVVFQNRLVKKDRTYVWLSWNVACAANDIFYVGRDTTVSTEAKELARQSLEKLEREQIMRETFVSALSHDLRTPMTVARMSAQLITHAHNDPRTSSKLTGRIIDCMDRADHMIRDLLDVNRISDGHAIQLNLKETNITLIAQEVMEAMVTLYGDRFNLDAPRSVLGNWDKGALSRVIENLLSNAAKYGLKGSPIKIRLKQIFNTVEIQVHNTGNPIAAKDLVSIFKKYRRADSSESGAHKGWGIGLTLAKGIVEAHQGTISVTSSAEDGTTFLVTLPTDLPSQAVH